MGLYNEGILGFFRGKVGRVIGSVVRGVHYMKGLGDIRTDNPTPTQLDQRLKFALMTAFMKPLKTLIQSGFQTTKTGPSALNLALSANLKHAVTGVSPNFTVNYEKFIFSTGSLPKAVGAGLATQDDAKLEFSWGMFGNMPPTDQATLLVYNPIQRTYVTLPAAAVRSALKYTLQLPTDFTDQLVHGWICFISADKKSVSDTVYLGSLTLI
jgi:hypothetical protein